LAFGNVAVSSRDFAAASLPARDGCFSRARCTAQMDEDVATAVAELEDTAARTADAPQSRQQRVRYCRQCELTCPVGNETEPRLLAGR
jgi:hypothetical protein